MHQNDCFWNESNISPLLRWTLQLQRSGGRKWEWRQWKWKRISNWGIWGCILYRRGSYICLWNEWEHTQQITFCRNLPWWWIDNLQGTLFAQTSNPLAPPIPNPGQQIGGGWLLPIHCGGMDPTATQQFAHLGNTGQNLTGWGVEEIEEESQVSGQKCLSLFEHAATMEGWQPIICSLSQEKPNNKTCKQWELPLNHSLQGYPSGSLH